MIFCLRALRPQYHSDVRTHRAFVGCSSYGAHSIFRFQLKIGFVTVALAAPVGLYAGYKFLLGAFTPLWVRLLVAVLLVLSFWCWLALLHFVFRHEVSFRSFLPQKPLG